MIDHHHLCKALLLAGSDQVSVIVVLDLERLDKDAFWVYMDNRGLVHPFDEDGKRRHYEDIPKHIKDLTDDPFRSLAGALRRKGGYAKDTTPFSEFLWADFMRRRFNRKDVEKDFGATLDAAFDLAKSTEADHCRAGAAPSRKTLDAYDFRREPKSPLALSLPLPGKGNAQDPSLGKRERQKPSPLGERVGPRGSQRPCSTRT